MSPHKTIPVHVAEAHVLVAKNTAVGSYARTEYFNRVEQYRQGTHRAFERAAERYGNELRTLSQRLERGMIEPALYLEQCEQWRRLHANARAQLAATYLMDVRRTCASALSAQPFNNF